MKTPDITPAQIKAALIALFGLIAAFGLPVSQEKQDAIIQVVTVLSPAIVLADAYIRNGRSRVLANPESIRELERPASPVANR